MSPAVLALLLGAALLHACWNALLRSGADRLWTMTVMSLATAAAAVLAAPLLPLPARAAWPYLGVSALLEVGYAVFLVLAYRHAELSQAYPMVRGSVPLLVTLGAALFAGDRLDALRLVGVTLVSLGIASLALGRGRPGRKAVGAALTTGIIIAGYTVVDGIGVRLSGNAYAYICWMFLLYGALLPLLFLLLRRGLVVRWRAAETWTALVAGLTQIATYGVVVWAYTLAPIGVVAAVREVSIVFAALIGWLFLGERVTARRAAACAVIALGGACLGWRG